MKNRINDNGITNKKKKSKIENSKDYNNYYKAIYMNHYKPRKKKFRVFRSENEITSFFSKEHNKNKNNDYYDILNDCETTSSNNSKKNNILYLVNINNPSFTNNKLDNNNQEKNNKKIILNKQKITKNSLPFCVYEHTSHQPKSKKNACKNKNCPGCIYCLGLMNDPNSNMLRNDNRNKKGKKLGDIYNIIYPKEDERSNASFDDNEIGNTTPNFLKPYNSNDKKPKNNDMIEDNEVESSIGTELSKRGDISVHCIQNIIKFPKEFYPNDDKLRNNMKKKDIRRKKNALRKDSKEKNKTDVEINPKDEEKDIIELNGRAKSEQKNNQLRKKNGLIKIKKFELLRDFD
jgi:hypothetical protein